MTPIRVIFPGRSDGVSSGPSAEQLEQKRSGNTTQFYQEVTLSEDKSRDWRRKLGGMLIAKHEEEVSKQTGNEYKADPDPNMTYILHDFPAGYRLFEHHTVHDGEGARDRRDTYLYGHPGGVKKRFRTPKEFFLHLWWLLTDEDGEPDNCACKLCVSDELLREVEAFVNQGKEEPSTSQVAAKKEPSAAAAAVTARAAPNSTPVTADSTTSVPAVSSNTNTQASKEPQFTIAPQQQLQLPRPQQAQTQQNKMTAAPPVPKTVQPRPSSSGRPAPQSRMAPSEIPQPRSQQQYQDLAVGSFLYRVGEIVWYQKGPSVGLAVIKDRSFASSSQPGEQPVESFYYILQPLSYPGATYETTQELESRLKPWYAYSPPGATHEYLNRPELSSRLFFHIDWQSMLAGKYGNGDTDVDASIFAAKTVDRSYTPIECVNNTGTQLYYNGIFLGAERVWRGDAVTLRSHQPTMPNVSMPLEILIVTDIVESRQAAETAAAHAAPPHSVQLIGDKYTYTSLPITIPANVTDKHAFLMTRIPTKIPVLPARVAEDLIFQNRVSVTRKQVANSWRLTAAQTAIGVADVRGRWYETARMLPIINPVQFHQMQTVSGEIFDVGRSLNARNENDQGIGNIGSPGLRFGSRTEVLMRSVPQGFKLQGDD